VIVRISISDKKVDREIYMTLRRTVSEKFCSFNVQTSELTVRRDLSEEFCTYVQSLAPLYYGRVRSLFGTQGQHYLLPVPLSRETSEIDLEMVRLVATECNTSLTVKKTAICESPQASPSYLM
jgi:hypothetical protein